MNTPPFKSDHPYTLNCNGRLIILDQPIIMGILNTTPDSFSDGGAYLDERSAIIHAEKMIAQGATIVDIGPQSTRPGARKIPSEEEIKRIGNIIKTLKLIHPEIMVSVDTFYASTAQYAADQGADIINDISAGQFDPEMLPTIARSNLAYVLMHVNSSYETMHQLREEENLAFELNRYFSSKLRTLKDMGIKSILLDPGFGFGKSIASQYDLINRLSLLVQQQYPLLVGISRKSFIYKPLGKNPKEVDDRTQELHYQVLQQGAKILRVHDVASTRQTIERFMSEAQTKI